MPSLILKLGNRELQRVAIQTTRTLVGRDERCELRIDNAAVSRRHAQVEFSGGTFRVVDVSSGNGILLNGQPVERAPLDEGDEIQLGKFIVVFTRSGGVDPRALAPARHDPVADADISDIHDTTHLDSDYMAKLRGSLDERDRDRRETENLRRQQAERSATRARSVSVLLFLVVLLLGAAVGYLILTRETGDTATPSAVEPAPGESRGER